MGKMTAFLFALILFASCEEEEISTITNDGTFVPFESDQPFEDVNLAYSFDYWELVWKDREGNEFVHFRQGHKCKNPIKEDDCLAKFEQLNSEGTGFGVGENGGHYFIRSNESGYNKTWDSLEELEDFLGHIDSRGDALLKSAVHGYYFEKNEPSLSSIRRIKDRYQIIALKTVSHCDPVQVDKFLLEIDKLGDISVLLQENYLQEEGCN